MNVIGHAAVDENGEIHQEIIIKNITRLDKLKLIYGILQMGPQNVIVLKPAEKDDE